MKYSKVEIKELAKAWIGVSIVFAIAMTGISVKTLIVLPFTLITAGIAFILHELAHKYVAQKYGCWAEFRADTKMLLIAAVISLTGFILLAPGGVLVHGATRQQHGKIALAGPLTNVILAGIFLAMSTLLTGNVVQNLALYAYMLNAYLAVFNMLPIPPFDGYSVWQWNKITYIATMAAGGTLLMISFI